MRVLIVEDEPRILADLRRALEAANYVVSTASEGEDGWYRGDSEDFDLVILDLGLPKIDGLTVLKRWRAAGRTMPVLILTARDEWREKVDGIDAGADDYLTKPFRIEELLARVRALVRRSAGFASPVLVNGPLEIDTRNMAVAYRGHPVPVTALEYRLLAYLMHQPGRVVSQSEIAQHIYEEDLERDSNAVEVIVARLRRKLSGPVIETRRGQGYLIPAGLAD
ncbi:response regulator transcription factor [Pseudoxanthobacter sp.]|uniref:response regulator transcription factor n=1 Tax=Pseudoxanthobacter sp. TaxID=1925742 RepID=UPI002FE11207